MFRLRAVVCGVTAFVVAAAASPTAHDLERTAVSLTFARDGSFVLDVANDPNWLLLRLESFAGNQSPSSSTPDPGSTAVPIVPAAERDARLRALAPVFIDRIVLWVDGQEVRPVSAEYIASASTAADGAVPLAAFRLRGQVEPDAHTLRWYYGMVIDPYPLTIRRADGRTIDEWIVSGDAWSRVEDLSGQFVRPTFFGTAREYLARGFSRILPGGVEQTLFLVGLMLYCVNLRWLLLQAATFSVAGFLAVVLATIGCNCEAPRIVSLFLALSIIYVAVDNLVVSTTPRWRLAAVFMWGLLHGFALAGVLNGAAIGQRASAIVSFYAGVVAAQATIITVTIACVTWYRHRVWYRTRIMVPASLGLAGLGLYWAARTIS